MADELFKACVDIARAGNLKPQETGMFRDHSCWKCKDGALPCVAMGGPRQCEYPHARND